MAMAVTTGLTDADLDKVDALIEREEAIFLKRQPRSAALARRAARSLAGGVTSSWQISHPQPVWISHGAGSKVFDADGNEYVDLHGGYGVMAVGHAHPAVVRAVAERIERTRIVPFNDLDALERVLEEERGLVAGMIMEPVMMNTGIIEPDDGYLAGVRRVVHEHGALLAYDEVKTALTVGPGGATR